MWFRSKSGSSQNSTGHASRLTAAASSRFQLAVNQSGIVFDDAQHAAIARLTGGSGHSFYLWGAVGRGKSLLADLYFDAVPTRHKRRVHFHGFFRVLQSEIAATRQPIEKSIDKILGSARAVLFDEFHVHDVADAVYLTKTLNALVERNILVLATSNYAPQELMPNPLFHERFIPAITTIESCFEVIPLGPGPDYRRVASHRGHSGFGAGHWRISSAPSSGAPQSVVELVVNGLPIRAVAAENGTATFTFAELCEQPVGIREYLSLAEDFDSLRLVNVPDLALVTRDPLTRLCNLIDVLCDRDQQLDLQANSAPERMLDAKEPPYDASRALSRLAPLTQTKWGPAIRGDEPT